MCVEEILRPAILKQPMLSFDDLMSHLECFGKKSRTACLWLDALIHPGFIIMRFVRSFREADWPLHIHTVQMMLPYFAAAGHWHYLRSAVVHLIKMTKFPKYLLSAVARALPLGVML